MKTISKTLIAMLVVFSLCLSMGAIAFANDYPVYSEWAKAEVLAAEENGLTHDLHDDLRVDMSRRWAAEFLVILVEKVTNTAIESSDAQIFDDVPTTIYRPIFDTINKAYAIGITKGVGNGKFDMYRDVTREEFAVMLHRAFSYIERTTGKKYLENTSDLSAFADKDEVSDWAVEAMGTLAKAEIMLGKQGKKLDPKGTISVEQGIVLSYRSFLLMK